VIVSAAALSRHGLIAGFILPVVQGVPLVLMSPFHWVRDPQICCTHSGASRDAVLAPNFAYNFLATRVRRSALDGWTCPACAP